MEEVKPAQTTAITRDYPPPPWTLMGSVMVAAYPVAADTAAGFVPEPLKLVTVPGGRAMAYLAIARYGPGSTLEYSELIAGFLVRHGARVNPFISHIAVDNPRSMRGGIDHWQLPKRLWGFEWHVGKDEAEVRVWDGVTLICSISEAPSNARLWPVRMTVPFFNFAHNLQLINCDFSLRTTRVPYKVQVGPSSSLSGHRPAGPLLTTIGRGKVVAHGPVPA
jgi:hypothetical protein